MQQMIRYLRWCIMELLCLSKFVLSFSYYSMEMNWLALIVASVVAFIIWALWYGPLFGKKWAWYMGMTEEDLKNGWWFGDLALHFVTIFVMIFVHFNVMNAFGAETISVALEWAFYTWLWYFFMREIGSIIWSKHKEWNLLWINGAYWLVILVVVSLVYVMI